VATYVIGDIQGCFATLERLLEKIEYDPSVDRVWLAGDLVNRGPRSLKVLRWARKQGDRVITVLGNHDLHLLAAATGLRERKPQDTLDRVLDARDRVEIIEWLRCQPLVHRERGFTLVHAGLHPTWTVERAGELAAEVETALRGDDWVEVLQKVYRRKRRPWSDELTGTKRLRSILSVMVSVRCVHDDGALCDFTGPPARAPHGCVPWFERRPARKRADVPEDEILFGHWALLGHRIGKGWISLDSGCVWGGKLTAFRLEDRQAIQVRCRD
jgi:bis(5'-nucleosyl)-tetraphosphatase (symmetrical)